MAVRARHPLVGVAVVVLAAAGGLAPAAGGQEPVPPEPPVVVDGGGPVRAGGDTVVRERAAEVAPGLLGRAGRTRVELDLFTDASIAVDVEAGPSGVAGWDAWAGTVVGEPDSSVVLVSDGTSTSGLVTSPDGAFRLRVDANGDHLVQELGAFPESADDAVPGSSAPTTPRQVHPDPGAAGAPDAATPPLVLADVPTHPVIDVLVAHTPEARAAAGSQAALDGEIAAAIASTNAAYASSGVDGQVRLVGTYVISSPGIRSTSEGLWQVSNPTDGVADGLLPAGDAAGADLVAVLTEGSDACGIGYLPGRTTVTDLSCAVGNLSFAHELGHNLGLHHDRYVAASDNHVYPYGYGYVDVAAGWRTIMAYNDVCAAQARTCTRLARFSNPDQAHGGAPLGRPWTAADSADNRLALWTSLPAREETRSRPAPFPSWVAFVQQQNRDLRFGATLTATQASQVAARLQGGSLRPSQYVDDLVHGSFDDSHAPITRLYWAYYLRRPDRSGLDHWVAVRRSGRSLAEISQSFASLQEFRDRYGTLTDRQFVERVYENILGRPGEPGGVTYWTGELATGTRTRGSVMLGFSESAEYKADTAHEVETVLLHRGMLQRVPTQAEIDAFTARRTGGAPLSRLIIETLGSDEYAARVG